MSQLTEYEYTGPDSGITLQDRATSTDVLLRQGQRVRLPADNAAVKTLVAMGHLKATTQPTTAQPEPEAAAKAATASKPKTAKE